MSDLIRVLSRLETIRMVCLTPRTWAKLEARGDTPPKTRLSERRIGYRVSDIKDWLDRRRESPDMRGTFPSSHGLPNAAPGKNNQD